MTTTLAQAPKLKNQVLLLIEEAFGYQKPHSFELDFLPLMHEDNWSNIYLHIDENEKLIGCGGFRKLSLRYKDQVFKTAFIGGIATESSYRGRGIGTLTMNTLIEQLTDQDLITLWSDQISFYEKFGFSNAGSLSENIGADWCAHNPTIPLTELTTDQREQIKQFYAAFQSSVNAYPIRTESDWEIIFQMSSVRCSLLSWGYVFANKGMDLTPLIHEVGCHQDDVAKVREKLALYSYWIKCPGLNTGRERFAGLFRIQSPAVTRETLSQVFIPGVDSI